MTAHHRDAGDASLWAGFLVLIFVQINGMPSPPVFWAGPWMPLTYFVLVFLVDTLAMQFGVPASKIILTMTATLATTLGSAGVRRAGRPLRAAAAPDGERGLLFRV